MMTPRSFNLLLAAFALLSACDPSPGPHNNNPTQDEPAAQRIPTDWCATQRVVQAAVEETMRAHEARDSDPAQAATICGEHPTHAVCRAFAAGTATPYQVAQCFGERQDDGRWAMVAFTTGNEYCSGLATLGSEFEELGEFLNGLSPDLQRPAVQRAARQVKPADLALLLQGLRYTLTRMADISDEWSELTTEGRAAINMIAPHLPMARMSDEEAYNRVNGYLYGLYLQAAEVARKHDDALLAAHGQRCTQIFSGNDATYAPLECASLRGLLIGRGLLPPDPPDPDPSDDPSRE